MILHSSCLTKELSAYDVVLVKLLGVEILDGEGILGLERLIAFVLERNRGQGPFWVLLNCESVIRVEDSWLKGFERCVSLVEGRVKFFNTREQLREMLTRGSGGRRIRIYDTEEEARVACRLGII